jgi:hypothetical protein
VSGTAVIAAGASSRVRSCEWHPDTKDDAGERTRNELARAELPQSAHLLPRPQLRGYAEIRNTAGGDYSFPHDGHAFRTCLRRLPRPGPTSSEACSPLGA